MVSEANRIYWEYKDSLFSDKSFEHQRFSDSIEKLLTLLEQSFFKRDELSVSIYKILPEVFDLRIKSLKLIQKKELNISLSLDNILLNYKNCDVDPKFEVLLQNMLFGIRSLRNVALKALEATSINSEEDNKNSESIPNISLDEFISLIRLNSIPNDQRKHNLNILTSSLMLEGGLMAGDLLIDSKVKDVYSSKIEELNQIIIENTQLYGSSAKKLGLFNQSKKARKNKNIHKTDDEDRLLSELGIEDFLKSID